MPSERNKMTWWQFGTRELFMLMVLGYGRPLGRLGLVTIQLKPHRGPCRNSDLYPALSHAIGRKNAAKAETCLRGAFFQALL
jgi:hypothetical protein